MKNLKNELCDTLYYWKKNENLMVNDLSGDYDEYMLSLNAVYDCIHENDKFPQDFIDKMERMENEEFIDVDDLNTLF